MKAQKLLEFQILSSCQQHSTHQLSTVLHIHKSISKGVTKDRERIFKTQFYFTKRFSKTFKNKLYIILCLLFFQFFYNF